MSKVSEKDLKTWFEIIQSGLSIDEMTEKIEELNKSIQSGGDN